MSRLQSREKQKILKLWLGHLLTFAWAIKYLLGSHRSSNHAKCYKIKADNIENHGS